MAGLTVLGSRQKSVGGRKLGFNFHMSFTNDKIVLYPNGFPFQWLNILSYTDIK